MTEPSLKVAPSSTTAPPTKFAKIATPPAAVQSRQPPTYATMVHLDVTDYENRAGSHQVQQVLRIWGQSRADGDDPDERATALSATET
jgi:hypothetical protein